jgi:hypothetical protein
MEKLNNGGGNWEAEMSLGVMDQDYVTVSLDDIELLEDALQNHFDSNCEIDEEMLREQINKGDWDFATDICFKFKQTHEAFALLKKLKERIKNKNDEKKKEDTRGIDSK